MKLRSELSTRRWNCTIHLSKYFLRTHFSNYFLLVWALDLFHYVLLIYHHFLLCASNISKQMTKTPNAKRNQVFILAHSANIFIKYFFILLRTIENCTSFIRCKMCVRIWTHWIWKPKQGTIDSWWIHLLTQSCFLFNHFGHIKPPTVPINCFIVYSIWYQILCGFIAQLNLCLNNCFEQILNKHSVHSMTTTNNAENVIRVCSLRKAIPPVECEGVYLWLEIMFDQSVPHASIRCLPMRISHKLLWSNLLNFCIEIYELKFFPWIQFISSHKNYVSKR